MMITQTIINFFIDIVATWISWLPGLPQSVHDFLTPLWDGLDTVLEYASLLDWVIPLRETYRAILVLHPIMLFIFTMNLFNRSVAVGTGYRIRLMPTEG